MTKVLIEEGDYKGNPMLIFKRGAEDRFPFQIGLKKARMILENLGEVRAFVMRHQEGFLE